MILEAKNVNEDEDSEPDEDKSIYVLCPILNTREKNEEDWHRSSIFQTWIRYNG